MSSYYPQNPRVNPGDRHQADLDYTEVAYVYKFTETVNAMNESVRTYSAVPIGIMCNYQQQGDVTENNDPDKPEYRIKMRTRYLNVISYRDIIVIKNRQFQVDGILNIPNLTNGEVDHAEVEAFHLPDGPVLNG